MTVTDAIIQGVVQGLTEFLPVSSSGHLAISQHILGVTESNLFFSVMLHLGTLLSVIIVYRKTVCELIKGFISIISDITKKKFSFKEMDHSQHLVCMLALGLVPLFLLFIPIPGSGGLNAKELAEVWAGSTGYFVIVGISLLFTSLLLAIGICANRITESKAHRKHIKKKEAGRHTVNAADAVCIGAAQLFAAIFPGLSRSGSTLAVGELRGLNKKKALDYSFVLGIPSILAAAVLEFRDSVTSGAIMQSDAVSILLGVAVSAVVGTLAILLFKWMLARDRMYIFVIYTAVAAAAVIIISIIELQSGVNIFTGEQLAFT